MSNQADSSCNGGCGSGRHCPFLNRADARCAKHFSLDQLQHTFEHCFGQYEACGVYVELLHERRARRAAARCELMLARGVEELIGDHDYHDHDHHHHHDANTDPDQPDQAEYRRSAGSPAPVVQVTVGGRRHESLARGLGQRASHSPILSDALGV